MSITLKAARVNKNLTQTEAAKALKVSVESLRKYETGKSSPNITIVKRMEDLYGVPYSDLIFLSKNTV